MKKRRVVLVSYTPLDAPGGVPRWNRDVKVGLEEAGHEVVHFSWSDFPQGQSDVNDEWDRARLLNAWLWWKRLISNDDIFLVDGFWGLGLENFRDVVSVAHGNWSHTTLDDVQKGVLPEFPHHHREQLRYRRHHLSRDGRIVAVSDFIAYQCKIQWGMDMTVINNGIDTTVFRPPLERIPRERPVVVHGTTTTNKGFDHVDALCGSVDADVWLLDELESVLKLPKYEALAQADLFVHPSAHEGNSYMVLEALASGVPIVSYDVGRLWATRRGHDVMGPTDIGSVLDRRERSPELTTSTVRRILKDFEDDPLRREVLSTNARLFAGMNSVSKFRREWAGYVASIP